ncbi:uncharacterized protein BDV17DRAFT_225216 [Aspergillus undulatus]|uniref:uncharacterized protein n=1 Tax=Aspergillus undulatus TaxID=1810928 RepID=UPI003CCD77A1
MTSCAKSSLLGSLFCLKTANNLSGLPSSPHQNPDILATDANTPPPSFPQKKPSSSSHPLPCPFILSCKSIFHSYSSSVYSQEAEAYRTESDIKSQTPSPGSRRAFHP